MTTMEEPLSPDKVRATVQYYAALNNPTEFDHKRWWRIMEWLEKYLQNPETRHLVQGWLVVLPGQPFDPISSSKLTAQQKNGIARWVGSSLNEDTQEWEARITFREECLGVLNAALYDYQQQTGEPHENFPFEVDGEPAAVVAAFIEEDPLWDEDRKVTGVAV